MNEHDLVWHEKKRELVAKCNIFDVYSSACQAHDGHQANFYCIDAPDWVTIVPLIKNTQGQEQFVMVKQFRHGSKQIYTEFPAGMMEKGEDPQVAALRELEEETGYTGKLTLIGKVNPNPALFNNTKYTFLAQDLQALPEGQNLDETERILVQMLGVSDMGRYVGIAPEFSHAITVQAYYFFLRHRQQISY